VSDAEHEQRIERCLKCDLHGKCPALLQNKRCPYRDKAKERHLWVETFVFLFGFVISLIALLTAIMLL